MRFAIVAMLLGVLVGYFLGEAAEPLGLIAQWIVNVIKWVALPIIFFSIIDTLIKTGFKMSGFFYLMLISVFNGLIAISIGLVLVNLLKIGHQFDFISQDLLHENFHTNFKNNFSSLKQLDFSSLLFNPTSLAILGGFWVGGSSLFFRRLFPQSSFNENFKKGVGRIWQGLFKTIRYLTYFIPIAVFSGMAKAVGHSGLSVFQSLASYVGLVTVGLALQILLVYQSWVKFGLKRKLSSFWSEVKEPLVYSFGVNSSLATLPLTLQALQKLGVSQSSARLSACVGTNFNNDGILLYEVVAILSLIQAFHIDLGLMSQVLVALFCLLATMGSAGTPEAGMMTLALMITMLGLPSDMLPLLISVDWLIGRMRSVTNVLGDMSVAIGIDVLGKNRTIQS